MLSDNDIEFKNKLFDEIAENWELREKYIVCHTDHKQMAELKVFINT